MKSLLFLSAGSLVCALLGLLYALQRPSVHPLPASAPVKIAPASANTAPDPPQTPAAPAVDAAQLKELHVNEAGRVPILEYHEIGSAPSNAGRATRMMHRSVDEFQADLQRLYDEGYRPVNLSEYLNNKMDLPLGTSPVILTFDDARSTQFRYRSDKSIDPDCAVGIMQEFTRQHPDFPTKAMFYVLPEGAFGSERYAAKKMRALLDMGCELGNHTLNHHYFTRMSDPAIAKEIAMGKSVTERMVPGAHLDTLALPGGCKPRSHNYGVLTSGEYNGKRYANRAVLDAWGGPAPSPISTKFDPLRIPRVLAVNGGGGIPEALDELKSGASDRYVSDGDPNIVTVPQRLTKFVKTARLNGLTLRAYDDGRKTAKSETAGTSATPHRRKHRRVHRRRNAVGTAKHTK